MTEQEIRDIIPEIITKSVQRSLKIKRPSRGYDGRLKPVSGSHATVFSNRINQGFLYNQINTYYQTDLADGSVELVVDFGLAEYGYWVNYGRKGALQGAKYPPLSTILTWARERSIPTFFDRNGTPLTEQQRAFLLQRSVGLYGMFATNFVQQGVNDVLNGVIYYLGLYAQTYIENLLENKKLIVKIGAVSTPL